MIDGTRRRLHLLNVASPLPSSLRLDDKKKVGTCCATMPLNTETMHSMIGCLCVSIFKWQVVLAFWKVMRPNCHLIKYVNLDCVISSTFRLMSVSYFLLVKFLSFFFLTFVLSSMNLQMVNVLCVKDKTRAMGQVHT